MSWHSKKQNSVALSTAEAEYIAAGLGCAHVLWMKQTLSDFGLTYSHVPIKCDNTSVISISKNLVQHSRTKHVEIRQQLADIFTKPLNENQFVNIRRQLGVISL